MGAPPPTRAVPHPAVLAYQEAERVRAMVADRARQSAIEELAEALGIPAPDVIPGAYVETRTDGRLIVARPLPSRQRPTATRPVIL